MFLDVPGEAAEAPEQRTQRSKAWATLLPTARIVHLGEAALSAERGGTEEVTVSSSQLSLSFCPNLCLKNPLCVLLGRTPLHCNKGRTSPLLLGFGQVPILKSGGNFASRRRGLAFPPPLLARHCYASSSGTAWVALRQVRKSPLAACSLM